MKHSMPKRCSQFWNGDDSGQLPKKQERSEVKQEDLGREWKLFLDALHNAAKKEWGSN